MDVLVELDPPGNAGTSSSTRPREKPNVLIVTDAIVSNSISGTTTRGGTSSNKCPWDLAGDDDDNFEDEDEEEEEDVVHYTASSKGGKRKFLDEIELKATSRGASAVLSSSSSSTAAGVPAAAMAARTASAIVGVLNGSSSTPNAGGMAKSLLAGDSPTFSADDEPPVMTTDL